MSCGCEKKIVTSLKEEKNLLYLIRRVTPEKKIKSETFEIEEEEKKEDTVPEEDVINIKRLEYILRKIEQLRIKKFRDLKEDD
jgi:predicted transcriptional regulator